MTNFARSFSPPDHTERILKMHPDELKKHLAEQGWTAAQIETVLAQINRATVSTITAAGSIRLVNG